MKIVGTAQGAHSSLPVLTEPRIYQAPPYLLLMSYGKDLRVLLGGPAVCDGRVKEQPLASLQRR